MAACSIEAVCTPRRGPSSTTTTRVRSAPMPPTARRTPPPVQQRGPGPGAPRRLLWRAGDSSTTMPWRSDRPSTAPAGDRQMRAASRRRRCSSNLWVAMAPADTRRRAPAGQGSLLGDAGNARPRRALVAQHAADDQIARGDGLQRQIGVRPSSTTTGSGRTAITDGGAPQLRPPPRRVSSRGRTRRRAIADRPTPAPDQIGPDHRLRDASWCSRCNQGIARPRPGWLWLHHE